MKYEDAGYIDLDHDDHSFEVDGKSLTEADAERLGEEIAQKHRAKRAAMGARH